MGARGRKVRTGDAAPEFRLKQHGGGEQALSELRERGPVLVAFYKVSCPTCQFTFPYLERMAAKSAIPFFGISQDDAQSTAAFHERLRVTFPSLLDSKSAGYPVSNAFGITNVPTMYVIEPDGRVSWH